MTGKPETRNLPATTTPAAPAVQPKGETLPVPADDAKPRPLDNQFRGMSEKPLDKKIADILCAEVKDDEVEVRVDLRKSDNSISGEFLYVPHATYRARFNAAVGPMGWTLHKDAPVIMDSRDNMVYWEGSLYILGRYAGNAVGQQRYAPGNFRMSYADAVEGAKSDCLTRCCKDIGMFHEIWNPSWRAGWYERNADRAEAKRIEVGAKGSKGKAAPTTTEETVKVIITALPPSEEIQKTNGGKCRIYKATGKDEEGKEYQFSTFSKTTAGNLKDAFENGLKVKITHKGVNNFGDYEVKRAMLVEGD